MSERISDEMLSAYFDGEASPEEVARIERSLKTNPELAKKLEEWKSLRRAIEHLPTYRSSDSMHRSIMSAIALGQSNTKAEELAAHAQPDISRDAISQDDAINHGNANGWDARLGDEAPDQPTVNSREDSTNHWRWAVALFATVAAVLLITIFYNPIASRFDGTQVAKDSMDNGYLADREKMTGDEAAELENGFADESSSRKMAADPDSFDAMPPGEMQMKANGVPQAGEAQSFSADSRMMRGGMDKLEADADAPRDAAGNFQSPSSGPPPNAGGFGGGGGNAPGNAPNAESSGNAEVQAPGVRSRLGNPGQGGAPPIEKRSETNPNDPVPQGFAPGNRAPRGRTLPPGGDQGINGDESHAANPAAGESRLAPPPNESMQLNAPLMMQAAMPEAEAGVADSAESSSAGRFYAVIDFKAPFDSMLETETAVDAGNAPASRLAAPETRQRQGLGGEGLGGEGLGGEGSGGIARSGQGQTEQGQEQGEDWQDEIARGRERIPGSRLAETKVELLPTWLSRLGFVQVEPLEELGDQVAQPSGIVEQIVSGRDRNTRFRLKQDVPTDDQPMIQLAENQPANRFTDEISPMPNDPATVDVTSATQDGVRVDFYEFEADAADVNELIVLLANQGVNVDLFYNRPVGELPEAPRRDASSGDANEAQVDRTEPVEDSPSQSDLERPIAPELAQGGRGSGSERSELTAIAPIQQRLGWDAVEMRRLVELRSDQLALSQRAQALSVEADAANLAAGNQPNTLANSQDDESANSGQGQAAPAQVERQGGNQSNDDQQRNNQQRDDQHADDPATEASADPNDASQPGFQKESSDQTLTLEDLSQSPTSYFWQGQSYMESSRTPEPAVARPQAMTIDSGGEPEVASADQPSADQQSAGQQSANQQEANEAGADNRPRPPRPRSGEPEPRELKRQFTPGQQGERLANDLSRGPEGRLQEKLVPQFARAGRVRLTLIVRTPIAAEAPTPRQANPDESPQPASSQDANQEPVNPPVPGSPPRPLENSPPAENGADANESPATSSSGDNP